MTESPNQQSDLISVIIPVYNTERYLSQCLKSVIRQDYRNLEIILVNDASTDNSLELCRRFADKDSRIKIIDKQSNEGLEQARRSGLASATGKYVMHVDSDDWLSNKMVISSMHRKAEETGADFVEINHARTIDRFGWFKRIAKKMVLSGLIRQPELFDNFFISFFGTPSISLNIWGKLYRKCVIDNASPIPYGITIGEDIVYNLQLFPYLRSIYIMDETGYCYRNTGMTSKFNPLFLRDLKTLYHLRERMIEKFNFEEARYGMNREMKELLKTDIQLRIRAKQKKEDIIGFLTKEITDPVYKSITEFYRKSHKMNDPFVLAMYAGNVEGLYQLAFNTERKLRLRQLLVNFATKTLGKI